MPIYHQHRLVHIHIPKTGGTAFESHLPDIAETSSTESTISMHRTPTT